MTALTEGAKRFLRDAGFRAEVIEALADYERRVATDTPYEDVMTAEEFRRRYLPDTQPDDPTQATEAP